MGPAKRVAAKIWPWKKICDLLCAKRVATFLKLEALGSQLDLGLVILAVNVLIGGPPAQIATCFAQSGSQVFSWMVFLLRPGFLMSAFGLRVDRGTRHRGWEGTFY